MSDNRHSMKISDKAAKSRPEHELGLLQMQILWMLKEPRHGYALMKVLNELKQTNITQGTLYPALQRLEALGLVQRKTEGRKHVWHMTTKGKQAMLRSCEDFCRTFHGIIRDFVCQKCH